MNGEMRVTDSIEKSTGDSDEDLLILHLSDIHIRDSTDGVLRRTRDIAAAACWGAGCGSCVIVVTGDLAMSGKHSEYIVAAEWLQSLRLSLRDQIRSLRSIETVIVPGNHDLNHDSANNVRGMVIKSLKPGEAPLPDVLQSCTEPQQEFFAHLEMLQEISDAQPPGLFWIRSIRLGNRHVQFICINSAWVSEYRERQGSLHFPASVLPTSSDADLTVAMFHHPFVWFESGAARSLRDALVPIADIILTGHEHNGDLARVQRRGHTSIFAEGDALQMHESAASAFGMMRVRVSAKRYCWRRVMWERSRYEAFDSSQGEEPLPLVHQRSVRATRISEAWERELSDLGVLLENAGGPVSLDALYVEPFVRREDPLERTAYASELASSLVASRTESLILVSGDERSGRTALAKFLFRDALRRGQAPVFVDGRRMCDWKTSPSEEVRAAFCRQYADETVETYVQLAPDRRLAIVDDFDLAPVVLQRRLLEHLLAERVPVIIMFRGALAWDFARKVSAGAKSVWYRILPLKRSQRELLVRNWQEADSRDSSSAAEVKQRDHVLRTFDTIIGRSFLPSSPFYMLSLLASIGDPHASTRESTHGHFYELLIKTHLIRDLSAPQFNIVLNYLAEYAWCMFSGDRDWMRGSEWEIFHDDYVRRFDVYRELGEMRDFFLRRSIVMERGDEFRFRYPYMYYYFAALYMRDHLGDVDVAERIRGMSQELSRARNANILLFLAHLSRDAIIVDSIVKSALSTFAQAVPATLDEDARFAREIGLEFTKVSILEPDAATSRMRHIEQTDEGDDEILPREGEIVDWDENVNSEILEVRQSLHSVDILGQILKNFPGSIPAERKLDIARVAYGTAMRLLGAMLHNLRENRDEVVRSFVLEFKSRYPNWTDDRASQEANRTLAALATLATWGVIRRLAISIGSVELVKTYDKMVGSEDTNAMQMLRVALDLEQQRIFPERTIRELLKRIAKNPLPLWVLRDLVLDHFHLFPVERAVRQRACAMLGIEWAQVQIEGGDLKVAPAGGDLAATGSTGSNRDSRKRRRRGSGKSKHRRR